MARFEKGEDYGLHGEYVIVDKDDFSGISVILDVGPEAHEVKVGNKVVYRRSKYDSPMWHPELERIVYVIHSDQIALSGYN